MPWTFAWCVYCFNLPYLHFFHYTSILPKSWGAIAPLPPHPPHFTLYLEMNEKFTPFSEGLNLNLTEEQVKAMNMRKIRLEIDKYRSVHVVHRSKDKKADLVKKLLNLIEMENEFLALKRTGHEKRKNARVHAKDLGEKPSKGGEISEGVFIFFPLLKAISKVERQY